jgi:uncharacterized membrane protein YqjE
MDAARDAMHAAGQPSAGGSVHVDKSPRQADPPTLEHALGRLWDELRGLLHDHLLLASLESRQVLASLVRILILAVSCAALVLGAWAAAMTAVLMWLVETGLSVALGLVIVVGGTLLLAGALFWLARRSVHELVLPATLRRLAGAPLPRIQE